MYTIDIPYLLSSSTLTTWTPTWTPLIRRSLASALHGNKEIPARALVVPHTPVDAARELCWNGLDEPGDQRAVCPGPFRDGHAETWSRTCPGPAARTGEDGTWSASSLAEVVRIYELRHWVELSCKQVKDELGRADFQVRLTLPSAATMCWSTARSPSTGMPGPLPRAGGRQPPKEGAPLATPSSPRRPWESAPAPCPARKLGLVV